jgi:hypothetical protein
MVGECVVGVDNTEEGWIEESRLGEVEMEDAVQMGSRQERSCVMELGSGSEWSDRSRVGR